ncbi:MAG: ABC transporter substrate-binding protein [Lachnospiraceae bacterium]|nr:ABC transporter substrate-binding protein [Lachnospiraceae bacterium]
MKKRLLALGLVLVMGMSLVACGNSGTSEKTTVAEDEKQTQTEAPAAEEGDASAEEVSVTLWTYPVGNWGDSATVDSLIADFNVKNPNIKVTVEYLDYTNGDDQINTAIEGGQAPDMVLEGPERLVANWGAKGLMVDLSEFFETTEGSEIYETVRAACQADNGEYYEYPLCMVAHCMAINKTVFEKADALQYMDLENHTWTTDDFFKAVQAVYDSGQKNVGAVYCTSQGGDQGTRALINNLYSGTFTNADHTEYTANSEENVKALEAIVAQDGLNFDASLAGGDEIQLFRQEQLAMSFCWNASQQNNVDAGNEAGKTNNGSEIIPMLFPSDDGKTELCGGIWGFGIFDNGDAAKIDASKKFIDFICNDNDGIETEKAVKASGFFPVRPSIKDAYAGEPTVETMEMFNTYFMPSMGDYYNVAAGWTNARTEWWNMLQRIGTGGDVQTECDTFTTNANAGMAQ